MIAENIVILLITASYYGIGGLITKTLHEKLTSKENFVNTVKNEGLYHITDEKAAHEIIKTQHLKAGNIISSYGRKRNFFFAGIPSFESVIHNVKKIENGGEITAIKISPTDEEIGEFDIRSYNDFAVSYLGDYHFKNNARIVTLVLDIDSNNNISYREKTSFEIDNNSYQQKKEIVKHLQKINKIKKVAIECKLEFKFIAKGLSKIFSEKKFNLVNKLNYKKTKSEISKLLSIKQELINAKDKEINEYNDEKKQR